MTLAAILRPRCRGNGTSVARPPEAAGAACTIAIVIVLSALLSAPSRVSAQVLRNPETPYHFLRYVTFLVTRIALTGRTTSDLITIVSTVATIIATGFVVGGWLKMYPIDTAIVTACHSGQGGTGDIAILTAADRMQLMPFAQIATRIGGAITVTVVLIVLTQLV
jgi:Na+/citrate or Na+/malate symporter